MHSSFLTNRTKDFFPQSNSSKAKQLREGTFSLVFDLKKKEIQYLLLINKTRL